MNSQPLVTLVQRIHNLINDNRDITQSFRFLETIRGIGDKIASFYLRDLVVTFNLNLASVQNRWLLQPIDIWVKCTVKALAGNQNMNKQQLANWIVSNSLQYNSNPEHINMGIWFYCALIANSEYRLVQSLQNINMAHSLINEFRSRINDVCQNC